MKRSFVILCLLSTLTAIAQSDVLCIIEGAEIAIPDAYDCEQYVNERIESFRFPTFPWIRFPPILSTLLPLFPRWPTRRPGSDEVDEYECPDEGIELIPYPNDCEKYILCVHGDRIKRNCAPDLHFSPVKRACMLPEDAECDGERVWECPDKDDLDDLVFLPNKEDCSKYYLCWEGDQIPMSCADVITYIFSLCIML